MRTILTLAATAALLTAVGAAPAQASESCHGSSSCTPTTIFTTFFNSHSGVPDPTRSGQYVGHFDSNGVPQSIITQPDSYVVVTEICVPVERRRKKYYPDT